MIATGYIRVSTEGQAIEGVSLDAQRSRITAWAAAAGAELLDIRVDAGISGGKAENRPGLQRALEMVCAVHPFAGPSPARGGEEQPRVLVVYSLSRLARSTRDAIAISERLEKAGADLVSLSEKIDTTSAAGKMIFRMLAVLAEFERDQISERTAAALQHMKAQGKRVGGVPYGYDPAGPEGEFLRPNAVEQGGLALMRGLRATGKSFRAIAAAMDENGYATKHGGKWTAEAVRGILKRK